MNYPKTSNAQIAKNSILLYIRTFITIFISVYTSRMILLKLGEDDFGIFSIVGGIAVIFSFLGNSFFSATQRFLTLALVKDDVTEYKRIFTTSIHCYLVLTVIIFLAGESIGLYIVNHFLNISPARMVAANYVYQFSLFSLLFALTNSPYKASIIAFEKFNYFAYSDIVFKGLRLAIVFAIALSPSDKLITYSVLYMSVSIINLITDKVYCYIQFKGCRFIRYWNKQLFIEITKFSAISLFKKAAETFANQGSNILINVFGGLVASASYGLSNQVWGTLTGFFLNIQMAFSSQITKSYGANDYKRFSSVILDSCRFSSYMVILLAIPLVINMPLVLDIWLRDVPKYAAPFCTAVIFSCFISALTNPLNTAILAVGKIKRYQIITSLIYFVTIPLSLIALHYGMALIGVFVIRIICQIIETIYSVKYLSRISNFSIRTFFKDFILSCICLLFSLSIPSIVILFLDINAILSLFVTTILGEGVFVMIVWNLGLTNSQRNKIKNYAMVKLSVKL